MHASGERHRVMVSADGPVDYEMDAAGEIELVTEGDIDENFVESHNDSRTATDTGYRVQGHTGAASGNEGYFGDTYDAHGPVTRIEVVSGESNNVRFFLDGAEVSNAASLVSGWRHGWNVLEVLGQGESVGYDVTANGSARRYQTAPHICASSGEDSVNENGGVSTVNGEVGGVGGDAYVFEGEVTQFSAGGPVTLRWNGVPVTAEELVDGVDDPENGNGENGENGNGEQPDADGGVNWAAAAALLAGVAAVSRRSGK